MVCACVLMGCARTAPIHLWHPGEVKVPLHAKLALAPLAGDRELAEQIEQQLLAQRPVARTDIAVITPEHLAQAAPVRLASTAALSSDLVALGAARAADVDVLLVGEVLRSQIDLSPEEEDAPPADVNMNQLFFLNRKKGEAKNESVLISWRVLDVESAHTIAAHSFTLDTRQASKLYPDLAAIEQDETQLLIAATARETWKSVTPFVTQERVRLAVPWLTPGSFGVWRGVSAARKGDWPLAEQRWSRVSKYFWFNAASRHNLALAKAAQEDFPGAKQELEKAKGLFGYRLPSNTLYWLDQRHRDYNQAHGLGVPLEGWSFADPSIHEPVDVAEPVEVADLPWWTAIPFTKPPGWSWRGWLTQPLVF
jgi:hypothetical protein